MDMDIFCGHHLFGFGDVMGLYLFLMLIDITIINPSNDGCTAILSLPLEYHVLLNLTVAPLCWMSACVLLLLFVYTYQYYLCCIMQIDFCSAICKLFNGYWAMVFRCWCRISQK